MSEKRKPLKPAQKTGIATAVLVAGIAAITQFEGSRSMPYRDLGGVVTVCKGHTGPDVRMGESWSKAQCDAQDKIDLAKADAAVKSCTDFPLSVNEQIAFNDFAYNVGGGAFCRSSMPALINVGQSKKACEVILKYVYVGKINCVTAGRKCPGIVARRQWEFDKCIDL
jgi:lysozyme